MVSKQIILTLNPFKVMKTIKYLILMFMLLNIVCCMYLLLHDVHNEQQQCFLLMTFGMSSLISLVTLKSLEQ